jgi:PAS domain S-box-containing protein
MLYALASISARINERLREGCAARDAFSLLAEELGRVLKVDRTYVSVVDRGKGVVRLEVAHSRRGGGALEGEIPLAVAPTIVSILERGEIVVIHDVDTTPLLDPGYRPYVEKYETRALLHVPIMFDGAWAMALTLSSNRKRVWTPEEVALASAAASQAAMALAQADLLAVIKASQREWQETIDAMREGVFLFDRIGRLVRSNTAACELAGTAVQPRELVGTTVHQLLCTGAISAAQEPCRMIAEVLRSGEPASMELNQERSGRSLLLTVWPFHRQGDAVGVRIEGTVVVLRDLTEVRRATADAVRHREFLARLAEAAQDGIFALSPAGEIVWHNRHLEKLSGYAADELERPFVDFVIAEDRSLVVEHFRAALRGEGRRYEVRAVHRGGELRHCQVTNNPVFEDGKVVAVLGILRDITEERRAAEIALRHSQLRALGQLAAGVAHDFNNALSAIVGRASMLRRKLQDPGKLEKGLGVIERVALDAAETVRRIQAFAREDPVMEADILRLEDLLNDALAFTKPRWHGDAHLAGVRYRIERDGTTDGFVEGNAAELREVFVNLIFNALDAMPQGGLVRLQYGHDEQHRWVRVRDEGTGVAPEVLPRLFEPFFTTKGKRGTGLGLAVSHSIVSRHGGTIEVESRLGEGTTFTIRLPKAQRARDQQAQVEAGGPRLSLRVLVIDDDADSRDALVELIEELGCRVDQAADGETGLALAETNHFDAIVTDLAMPGMDGAAVLARLRQRHTEARLLLVTGYGGASDQARRGAALADVTLDKPIRPDVLAELLRAWEPSAPGR